MSLPDPKAYTRASVGPVTYLAAVRALSQSDVQWSAIRPMYDDYTTAGTCAVQVNGGSVDAQLMCEVWDYLERMPEPTDMPRQHERQSLLLRLREWGNR